MRRTPTTLAAVLSLSLLLSACGGGQDPQPDAGSTDAGATPPTCEDGQHNGDETDVDCGGGGGCTGCANGATCAADGDCSSGYCGGDQRCAAPACDDGARNGGESDVDCGGACAPCAVGAACAAPADCESGVCAASTCAPASCADGVKNGDESDVDCGGSCAPCTAGEVCLAAADCGSGVCEGGVCQTATCMDEVKNGTESDVDCGGGCGGCEDGRVCAGGGDCQSAVCEGGVCQAPTCEDGAKNGTESDVDCGGECPACGDGAVCASGADCQSASCKFGKCQAASCSDGLHNGDETALDCGGPSCSPCGSGLACAGNPDCASKVCDGGVCAQATCSDGVQNQNESDVDCGGACAGCGLGQACNGDGDCDSGACIGSVCDVALPPGLLGEYFSNYTDLVTSRVDPLIDFSWPNAGPPTGEPAPGVGADAFSVRWTGFIEVPATADYTFVTRADDGARMWVHGQRIIDDWRGHAATRTEATVTLTAGTRVPIKVEYCDIRFGGVMELLWRTPTMAEEIVPTSALVNDGTPSGTPGPLGPYRNPLFESACPDPSVIAVPGTPLKYYAVCSGGAFAVHETPNLVQWTATSATVLDAAAPVAPWAQDGSQNRGPALHAFGSDLVAYYSALHTDGTLAIGAGVAADVLGPYAHQALPLVTHPQGATDPAVFEETGTRSLVYRVGGNASGVPAEIYLRELSANGLSFAPGSAPQLLFASAAGNWEGNRLESPTLVKRNGGYYVFFGGNDAAGDLHRLGAAHAAALTGPWTKATLPLLGNNATWLGPGSGTVLTVGTEDYLLYSGWPLTSAGLPDFARGRRPLMDRLVWGAGTWPAISDGTPSTVFVAPPGNE